jgi:hypothetical protein
MAVKPIGVWISLAIAILGLSGWLGWTAGSALGTVRYRAYPLPDSHLPLALRRQVKGELDDLQTAELLHLLTETRLISKQQGKPISPPKISSLDAVKQKAKTDEMRPVIEAEIAIACATQAAEDQSNDASRAAAYMSAAQSAARSLGWSDVTEETVKSIARSQILPPLRSEVPK